MSDRTVYKLFGYPIAHSASPAFHNKIFEELGLPNRYTLHDTVHPENLNTEVKSDMLEIIHSDTFGGASVTMWAQLRLLSSARCDGAHLIRRSARQGARENSADGG